MINWNFYDFMSNIMIDDFSFIRILWKIWIDLVLLPSQLPTSKTTLSPPKKRISSQTKAASSPFSLFSRLEIYQRKFLVPCSFLLPKADAKKAEQVAETERRANLRLDPGAEGDDGKPQVFHIAIIFWQFHTSIRDRCMWYPTMYFYKICSKAVYYVYCCVEKRKSGHSY